MWPVGVKALENALDRFRLYARPVVVDGDLHRVAQALRGDAHRSALRRERARIFDQIVDDLAEPRVVPAHRERTRWATLEGERDLHIVAAPHFVRDRDDGFQEPRQID